MYYLPAACTIFQMGLKTFKAGTSEDQNLTVQPYLLDYVSEIFIFVTWYLSSEGGCQLLDMISIWHTSQIGYQQCHFLQKYWSCLSKSSLAGYICTRHEKLWALEGAHVLEKKLYKNYTIFSFLSTKKLKHCV